MSESRRVRYSVVKIGEPNAELEPKDIRLFTNADETIYMLVADTEEAYPEVYTGKSYNGKAIAEVVCIADNDGNGVYQIVIWLPQGGAGDVINYVDSIISTRYGPTVLFVDDSTICREIIMEKATGSGR